MADRTTKIILAAIALGLWANVALPLLRPTPARAADYEVTEILNAVNNIANGVCVNRKIC